MNGKHIALTGVLIFGLWACTGSKSSKNVNWQEGSFAQVRALAGDREILTFFFTDW